jgi:hypothetical protein
MLEILLWILRFGPLKMFLKILKTIQNGTLNFPDFWHNLAHFQQYGLHFVLLPDLQK